MLEVPFKLPRRFSLLIAVRWHEMVDLLAIFQNRIELIQSKQVISGYISSFYLRTGDLKLFLAHEDGIKSSSLIL